MSVRRALGWVVAFVATRALAFGLHGLEPEDRYDLKLLFQSAGKAAGEAVPYLDFPFEYPPAALAIVRVLGALGGGAFPRFVLAFHLFALAADASLLALVLALAPVERRLHAGIAALLVPLLLFPLAWARLDLLSLAPLAAAMLLARRERPDAMAAGAGALVAIGGAVKIMPWVALPAILIALPKRRALAALIGFSAALLLVALPSLLESGPALISFLTYHKERGLQVESTLAVVATAAARLSGTPLGVVRAARSWQLAGPTPDAFARAATPLLALALAAALATLARARRARPLDPARAAAAVLVVFLVAANVLSPQFVLVLPLAVAALPTGAMLATTLAAAALTTAIYPFSYAAVLELAPWATALVALRNVLLALIAAQLLRRVV